MKNGLISQKNLKKWRKILMNISIPQSSNKKSKLIFNFIVKLLKHR